MCGLNYSGGKMDFKEETVDTSRKVLDEINQKRKEIQKSGLPLKTVALLLKELNERELAILKELDTQNNQKKHSVLSGVITTAAIVGGIATLGVILSKVLSNSDDTENEDTSDEEDTSDDEASDNESENDNQEGLEDEK